MNDSVGSASPANNGGCKITLQNVFYSLQAEEIRLNPLRTDPLLAKNDAHFIYIKNAVSICGSNLRRLRCIRDIYYLDPQLIKN